MTRRIAQPDTDADIELRRLLDAADLPAFTMVAGAGSGKTTSLVKALSHVLAKRSKQLRRRGQKVACITYTEGAAREVLNDVGSTQLAHVSTIHSFLWSVVSPFQRDIRAWSIQQATEKLARLTEEQRNFGPRVRAKKREKTAADIQKLQHQLEVLPIVLRFQYGVATDFSKGSLGHEDIIRLGTNLLRSSPLLRKLMATRFPFVFVDESQDTFPEVVESLKQVRLDARTQFCLGFIGDPMQKVYPRGVGSIPPEEGWVELEKPENFRSPRRVLDLMNQIRFEGDALNQVSGVPHEDQKDGSVHFFVLPTDTSRTDSLVKVRQWLDARCTEGAWTSDDPEEGARILVIAHRMAARRLGFEALYSAFHDSGSSSLSKAFDEGDAWPARYMLDVILPLASSSSGKCLALLRQHSPEMKALRSAGVDVREALGRIDAQLDKLRALVETGGPGSIGATIRAVAESEILELDPRIESYLLGPDSENSVIISDSTIAVLKKFECCDVRELEAYARYVTQGSPYVTHQGVKGTEFPRVVVILDDEEGRHNQFSYDKLLGVRELSPTDESNIEGGSDSVVDRTRRLLYVCASRSTDGLAVILYAQNVEEALTALRSTRLPDCGTLLTLDDLNEREVS